MMRGAGKILLACPMNREAEVLRRNLGNKVEIMATGLGVRRSLPGLLRLFREDPPAVLIFTGSASQLDPSLELCQVVLAREWCFQGAHRCTSCDPSLIGYLEERGWPTVSRAVSLDRPVLKADDRREMFEETGCSLYDSVSAAVVRAAQTEHVPCIAPKIIAHTVGAGLTSFWNNLDHNMNSLVEYLRGALEEIEAWKKRS